MAGDGYFMGLLNETHNNNGMDWNGLGSPPEEQPEKPVDTIPTATGNKKTRNKNFSEKEDVVLVRAWLNISTDAIPGINQKRGTYWSRIHNFFHSDKEITVDGSPNSLSHRWGIIQECVNKFCGCFSAIEDRNQSGKTLENKVYKEEDKENKSFQLLHCWNILRYEPKWHEKMNQLTVNKSSQKKHKACTGSILDLTGNQMLTYLMLILMKMQLEMVMHLRSQ